METAAGKLALGSLTVQNGVVVLNAANSIGIGDELDGGEIEVGATGALGTAEFTLDGGELLGRANATLSNMLAMSGVFAIAAAHGTTLTLNSSAGWSAAAGTQIEFGTPGQDGVVVWGAPGTTAGPAAVTVTAGTLRARAISTSRIC